MLDTSVLDKIEEAGKNNMFGEIMTLRVNDIKPSDVNHLQISKRHIEMGSDAIVDICKMMELPSSFYSKLHNKDEKTWSRVCDLFLENKSKEISLLITKDKIERIVSGKPPKINPLIKLARNVKNSLDPVKNQIHRMKAYVSSNGVRLHIGGPKIEPLKGDIFSAGIELKADILSYNVSTSSNIERLFCTNMCTLSARHTSGKTSLENDYTFNKFLVDSVIGNLGTRDYMKERLTKISAYRASMAEAYNVCTLLSQMGENIPGINEQMSKKRNHIPLVQWMAKYGKTMNSLKDSKIRYTGFLPDISKQEPWMKTAVTPMPLYKLFNILTWVGSHLDSTRQTEAAAIAIESGRIIEKDPDMSSIVDNPFNIDFSVRPDELKVEMN